MAIRVREFEDSFDDDTDEASNPSAQEIDDVVHQLNSICRTSSLEFALRVGSVIIHHFYGGEPDAWRLRGPKVNSFRRLAKHPELALSAGALYRCVAIFDICDRHRAASRWRRLGASHLRTVIGIPADKQEYLLSKANEERWSVQTLQAKALTLREGHARGGRRVQSALGKRLRSLDHCLQDWDLALDCVPQHELGELERTLELLQKMQTSVEELVRAVQTQRSRLVGSND
jgi:hypothetical protein